MIVGGMKYVKSFWAKRWLDEVYRLSGVKPIVYMSQSRTHEYDWSIVVNAGYNGMPSILITISLT